MNKTTNQLKQDNLDFEKWQFSRKNGRDMSGTMPYCLHCPHSRDSKCHITQLQRSATYECARAYNKMVRANNKAAK